MSKADRERKMRSAERLFDVIGMIDDRIIADAVDFHSKAPNRKEAPFLRRYAVSLVALLLTVSLIGGFVVANLSNSPDSDSLNDNLKDNVGEIVEARKSLDFVLSAATPSTVTLSLEEIDFFDGEVSIIWNCGGEDEYHKLNFGGKNAESEIKNCMSKSVEQIPTDVQDDNVCKVWISYGNGEVVSPYLKESAGNVGYAELFEYSPEVVPSDSFCDFVSNTLNN